MDLPDCPPGAEGYQDSVTEIPKKPEISESTCTKAEKEFQEHLLSLKIKTENGSCRCMVERKGRDVAGKWVYLCYPCAVVCSGEKVLQTHISGKKHKTKLGAKNVWPLSIFEEHPYVINERANRRSLELKSEVPKQPAEEDDIYNYADLDKVYGKLRKVRCHIQDALDEIKVPILGLEYLIEHPPAEEHHDPAYTCALCNKQGHPRTIINHLTCFMHKQKFLNVHFPKASAVMRPFRSNFKFRVGVLFVVNRLAQAVEDKYGRGTPVNIDKHLYEREKDRIGHWITKGPHFNERLGSTFVEVVDVDLIQSLEGKTEDGDLSKGGNRDPSPPVVTAPNKPRNSAAARRAHQRVSAGSLSDISDEPESARASPHRVEHSYDYGDRRQEVDTYKSSGARKSPDKNYGRERHSKFQYKLKMAEEKQRILGESAKKSLAYHEKNPEKHPLYPLEWKKFWNRRYKEIQSEGKDPSKYDFKPEWIDYWMKRMKELHEEELGAKMSEVYRQLRIDPTALKCTEPDSWVEKPSSHENYRDDREERDARSSREKLPAREYSPRRRSSGRRYSPESQRGGRHRSPERRRYSPDRRSLSNVTKYSLDRRGGRRSEERLSQERRSPTRRRSPRHYSPHRSPRRSTSRRSTSRRSTSRRSPPRRSPRRRSSPSRSMSPKRRRIDSTVARQKSISPLSKRALQRNCSPVLEPNTVLISDDELRPEDSISPWNSEDDSLGFPPEPHPSRGTAEKSRGSRGRDARPTPHLEADFGSVDNIVATLRLLVALEDYLGSLGPKVVDLLGEAIKMEKEKANSSEELLERENAVVLIETVKEKLKGAAQAGLVSGSAAAAVRAAVVRSAAVLHQADRRIAERKQKEKEKENAFVSEATSLPIAGVGEVNRELIAQQMAAALIAQGKTDVSSEELAQLVDAVVGMAEAKKRESQIKQDVPRTLKPSTPSTSALQLLQSAYDDKLADHGVADAMDGLSDSDLETLLKNFNELSAEEQHSLIAYLKKLEAREPVRVERLRQYVTMAATIPPLQQEMKPDLAPVTIESDDDDYTVDDVFKSATQKVKENQIAQEMEIVKKSLEESKAAPPESSKENSVATSEYCEPVNDICSASGLLALVQASLKSASAPTSASGSEQISTVSSHSQPRSFGDVPENPMPNTINKPLLPNPNIPPNHQMPLRQVGPKQGLLRTPQLHSNEGSTWGNRSESLNSKVNTEQSDMQVCDDPFDNSARVATNQSNQNSHSQGEREPSNSYNQGSWANRTDNCNPIPRQENFQTMRFNSDKVESSRGSFTGNRMPYYNQQGTRPQQMYNNQSQYGSQQPFLNKMYNQQQYHPQIGGNESFQGRGGRGQYRGRGRGYY